MSIGFDSYLRNPSKIRLREQNKRLNSHKYQKIVDFVKAESLHQTSPASNNLMNVGAEELKMLSQYHRQRVLAAVEYERKREEFQSKVRDFYVVPKPLNFADRGILLKKNQERAKSVQPSVLRDIDPLRQLMYQKKVVTDQILSNVFNKPRADCLFGGDKRIKRI